MYLKQEKLHDSARILNSSSTLLNVEDAIWYAYRWQKIICNSVKTKKGGCDEDKKHFSV